MPAYWVALFARSLHDDQQVVTGTPISATETAPAQQFSKSFALRDQGHLVFRFTFVNSELKRIEVSHHYWHGGR